MLDKPILVLDDDIDRHNLFVRYIGNTFNSVYTAEDLLHIIEKGWLKAKILFLDHDLGTGMDGTAFVKALAEKKPPLPTVTHIYIHSANVSKNSSMAYTLKDVYPDKVVKLFPVTQLSDVWEDNGRNKDALRDFLAQLT
jgi:DNA-binding NtrC family response regulator